jgi:hypothetical protein
MTGPRLIPSASGCDRTLTGQRFRMVLAHREIALARGRRSVQPLPQNGPQPPSRTENAGLDGPDRDVQDRRDLVVLESLHVLERQSHAPVLRQHRERTLDRLATRERALDVTTDDERVGHGMLGVASEIDAERVQPTPLVRAVRAHGVHRDPRQPRAKRALLTEMLDRVVRADERLLREIVRVAAIGTVDVRARSINGWTACESAPVLVSAMIYSTAFGVAIQRSEIDNG